jgi:pheromone shutdown protein TraB
MTNKSLDELKELNVVRHLPQNEGESEVFLVGTAHNSSESRDLLANVIKKISPDLIAVELCRDRFTNTKRPVSKPNLTKQIVIYTAYFIGRVKDFLKTNRTDPDGLEVQRATELASENNIPLALIDAPENQTLQTFIDNATHKELFKRLSKSTPLVSQVEVKNNRDISNEEINRNIDQTKEFPAWWDALMDTRNKVLATNINRIRQNSFNPIVVQVGAGHLNEVERLVKTDENPELQKETIVDIVQFTEENSD